MVTRSTPRTGYRQTRRKVTSPAQVIAAVDAAPRYGCRSLLTDSDSSQSVLRAQVQAQPRRAPAQSERSTRAGGRVYTRAEPPGPPTLHFVGAGEGRANALMRAASRCAVRVVEGSTAISLSRANTCTRGYRDSTRRGRCARQHSVHEQIEGEPGSKRGHQSLRSCHPRRTLC